MNTKAIDAFIARKAQIDQLVERIAAASEDHFAVGPDEINWGHVASLARIAEILTDATRDI